MYYFKTSEKSGVYSFLWIISIIEIRLNEGIEVLRPLANEGIEEFRHFYLDCIKVSSELIKVLQTVSEPNAVIAREIVEYEQNEIRTTYEDLKEAQRWWITEGKDVYESRQKTKLLE